MSKLTISLIAFVLMSPIVLFGLPTFVVLSVGFVPAFVAFVTDKERERACTVSVFYMNACGVFPQVIHLWHGSHTLEGAVYLLTDHYVWLTMYGAAAVGWGIYLILPVVIAQGIFIYGYYKVKSCRARQKVLIEDWGDRVKK
jgi:peptidoglycan/LPS O-acetylase OafA/YrhL